MANAKGAAGKATGGSRGKAARMDARAVEQVLQTAERADDRLCLVSGPEEALRRLVIERLLRGAAEHDITVVRLSATDAGSATAIEQSCEPTLFGGQTWLVVTELEQASEDAAAAAKRALGLASPDLRIILSHGGGNRGRGVITAAQQAGARLFETRQIAASALPTVLIGHARAAGCVLTSEAAAAITRALGQTDLTALLAAVDQLASDAPQGRIDLDLVHQTLVAAGSENQFEIADLVWHRSTTEALAAFRQLAERNGAGSACVTVVAALSYSLRSLARYVAERPSGSPWQVASALGVPAWKVDSLAVQARLWRPAQLAAAAVVLAEADADAKGGLGDAGALDPLQKLYVVERLILRLTTT